MVIIGAGVHGASAAYHLARAGRQVVVVEKGEVGSGSSGKSGGIIRCHYSTESMVRLALRAAQLWPGLAEELGAPTDYVRNGLIMMVEAHDAPVMRSVVEMQRQLGLDTDIISMDEVRRLLPDFNAEGLALAALEQVSGYADPYAAAAAFGRRARAAGAELYTNTRVTGFDLDGDQVRGVVTDRGTIRCGTVVNAAGAWAAAVGRLAGLDLPVTPGLLQMAAFHPGFAGYTATSPTWVDMSTMTYCRPDAGGLMLCGGGLSENAAWDEQAVDPDDYPQRPPLLFEAEMAENLAARCPWSEDAPMVRSWVGIDGSSPDFHLIFGPMPGLRGWINVVGGSGNSFKLSPATGEAVAELVTTGRCTHLDTHAFGITRFAEGREFRGKYRMHIVG